jgi:hypothetical protein
MQIRLILPPPLSSPSIILRIISGKAGAAVEVSQEVLQYYRELGRDIVKMHAESRRGDNAVNLVAVDLKREMRVAKFK